MAVALLPWLFLASVCVSVLREHPQEHTHEHAADAPAERPKVFLDKSPKIVEYQLKRLDNSRLLLVEREPTDKKYAPVYRAILLRPGMSRQDREESLAALTKINDRDAVIELLEALKGLDPSEMKSLSSQSRSRQGAGRAILELLMDQPAGLLKDQQAVLARMAIESHPLVQTGALIGLLLAGDSESAWGVANQSQDSAISWLTAIALLRQSDVQERERERVMMVLGRRDSAAVTRAASLTLASIRLEQASTFTLLVRQLSDPQLREASVRGLLMIGDQDRSPQDAELAVRTITEFAESTAAELRTSDEFVDAMTLAEQLLVRLPPTEAAQYRQRLRTVFVRVVRIRTVHEEMRYDVPFVVVEAGRPVQLILQNEDLMPHNLVITRPGKLREIAELGGQQGSASGFRGLPYVPDSSDVLAATGMVEAGKSERLTFDAPAEPGEYPYVCTFPKHWMRMYGVLLVVPDLDAWQRNPVLPRDPLGNTRSFVRSWSLKDFEELLTQEQPAVDSIRGQALFREATCLQCHRLGAEGGQIGPDLNDVLKRHKGDRASVLREILDPSWKIESKYVMSVVITKDGRSLSGIIQKQDETSIALLVNPEAGKPEVIARKEIEEIVPSSTSMMPKALLDKFSAEEILQLLNHVTIQTSESTDKSGSVP